MTSTHPAGMATNYPISNRSSLISISTSAGNPSSSTPTIIPSPSTTTPTTNNHTTQIAQPQLPDILERPRDKTRNHEVAASALAFLYSEILSYTQNRVTGIADLEKRLSLIGYHIGQRLLSLHYHRLESPASSLTGSSLASAASKAKPSKRETRLLPVLRWIHSQLWKAAFGKVADNLERSTENPDEYMISTNVPTFSNSICVPNDMSQLSVEAITAGMVEAALDGLGFPARVTAHSVPTPEFPNRNVILIKLEKEVMQREEALGPV